MINGYRSFRKRTELPLASRTTILIGPNDHGKTNALLAIEKLNPEKVFEPAEVNDLLPASETGYVAFNLGLTDQDIRILREALPPLEKGDAIVDIVMSEAEKAAIQAKHDADFWFDNLTNSKEIELITGPERPLEPRLDQLPEQFKPAISRAIFAMLPKVSFFKAETLRQLPDLVDLAGLEQNEVMQGVFRLAGIWESRAALLSSNSRKNQDELREASKVLTRKIRENWTQGRDLEFYLEYVDKNIRLTVKDTARTVTALAERSEGFTAYFAMRMLLVARTDEARPNGYIFMFDEPGLNLHPKGQVDLQNVFEDIARTNQIIYSTHSVFLINKNHPDRNHLVFKNEDGSNIDNKPFVGGWAKVKEHLGLYLSANFLFSDKVLLAEGATDEIYLPLILQGLIERNLFAGDLNAFAVHSSLKVMETIATAGMYLREQRQVAVLVDGDDEGNARKKRIDQWAKDTKRKCPVLTLADYKPPGACSIEDFLDLSTLKDAVVLACKEAIADGVIKPKSADTWEADLRPKLDNKGAKTMGKRLEETLQETFDDAISDVWIARKYSELIQRNAASLEVYWRDESLAKLGKAIWAALELPNRADTAAFVP